MFDSDKIPATFQCKLTIFLEELLYKHTSLKFDKKCKTMKDSHFLKLKIITWICRNKHFLKDLANLLYCLYSLAKFKTFISCV